MPSIILECSHCGAEKIGFSLVHEILATIKPSNIHKRFRALLVCTNCEEEVVAIFDAPGPSMPNLTPIQCSVDPRKLDWALTDSYPKAMPSICPDHTPDNLKLIFYQAANTLKRREPDASGAMSRKVMDVSTQQLLGGRSKEFKNIYERIEDLAGEGKLTPDLKDWAHQLRLGGADAAHDQDPFTQEQAHELLDFAELYLTYVYTLPGRLKERRERAVKEKAGAI